jgi:precorrin-8X/cobalt-precorrin-8 methylmutase
VPHPIEPHPIETESFAILARRVDLTAWPDGARQVVARMIHATADESFAETARIGEDAVSAACEALAGRAPVVCDARMVLAGIPQVAAVTTVRCFLDSVSVDIGGGTATRSEAAIEAAATEYPSGAVWVVGNAPTALARLVRLYEERLLSPVVVIGVPVGYVGAAEAKEALWSSPLRRISITNTGPRGGSPVAAAALNALWRMVGPQAPR